MILLNTIPQNNVLVGLGLHNKKMFSIMKDKLLSHSLHGGMAKLSLDNKLKMKPIRKPIKFM